MSTMIVPGMRTSATWHATTAKALAALGTHFECRSILASDLHVEREANALVTVQQRHPAQLCRHRRRLPNISASAFCRSVSLSLSLPSLLLPSRSRGPDVARRRPALAARSSGQGHRSERPLAKPEFQVAPRHAACAHRA